MPKKFIIPAALLMGLSLTAGAAEGFIPTEDARPGQWFLRSVAGSRERDEPKYRARLDKLAPPEKRALLAEEYHRMLEEKFISNRAEDAAIEKELGWKSGDFTWHNNRFYSRTGCTSWLITPELSATGSAILEKNRDYTGQNLISARLFRAAPGRYKVLTVGDLWSSGAGAAMNEKGLMITQNDASAPFDRNFREVTVGSPFLLRYLAEHCATAEEAFATLKRFHETEFMRSTDLWFIADPRGGMVVESTGRHISAAKVPFAFEVRANNFLLPGMRMLESRSQKAFLNGANRRYTASEFLRKRAAENGKIGPLDLMELARLRDAAQEKEGFRQVCMKNTIAGTMMAPDAQDPEILSVAFVAVGPPRHTIFLPIPMAAKEFPEDLANGEWGLRSFALADKLGLDHDRLPEFAKVETKLVREYFAAQAEARKLLRQGKRPQAADLLDNLFRRQYREAKAFLQKQTE